MRKGKIIRMGVLAAFVAIIIGGSIGLYLFNMPHPNIELAKADYQITAASLVTEYLENAEVANEKYLAADGNSKILEVTGTVYGISTDFREQVVIVLKESSSKAGVSITFAQDTNAELAKIVQGDVITSKGVINSGAAYDTDVERYRDVVINRAYLIK